MKIITFIEKCFAKIQILHHQLYNKSYSDILFNKFRILLLIHSFFFASVLALVPLLGFIPKKHLQKKKNIYFSKFNDKKIK